MQNRTFWIVLALAVAAGAYVAGKGQRSRPMSPEAPGRVPFDNAEASDPRVGGGRVAFVDLQTVYNSCKQSKAFEAELIRFVADGKAQLKPLDEEIGKLQERYKLLGPEAPDRAKLEEEIRRKQKEYMDASEPWERDLKKKQLVKRDEIYRRIRDCAARLARERGFEMVLADIEEPRPNLEAGTSRDLQEAEASYMMKVHRKFVLHASKDVDLTEEVLEAVNAEP